MFCKLHKAHHTGLVVQAVIVVGLILTPVLPGRCETISPAIPSKTIPLPEPRYAGDVSVEPALLEIVSGDKRSDLSQAALRQGANKKAPAVILFCAVYERATVKYGQRGIRYVHIELVHAAQNACLQAIALGLNTTVIGAFQDSEVKMIANLPADEQPLYFLPIGR